MKRQLWFWVLVAIAAGIVFGLVAPGPATDSKWLADAFLQLIKTVTAPVIFVTVVIGIASLGDMARAGGLALRALGYFLGATVLALALGQRLQRAGGVVARQRLRQVGQRGDGAGDGQAAVARGGLGALARDLDGDQRARGDGHGDHRELKDQQAPGEAFHPHAPHVLTRPERRLRPIRPQPRQGGPALVASPSVRGRGSRSGETRGEPFP